MHETLFWQAKRGGYHVSVLFYLCSSREGLPHIHDFLSVTPRFSLLHIFTWERKADSRRCWSLSSWLKLSGSWCFNKKVWAADVQDEQSIYPCVKGGGGIKSNRSIKKTSLQRCKHLWAAEPLQSRCPQGRKVSLVELNRNNWEPVSELFNLLEWFAWKLIIPLIGPGVFLWQLCIANKHRCQTCLRCWELATRRGRRWDEKIIKVKRGNTRDARLWKKGKWK